MTWRIILVTGLIIGLCTFFLVRTDESFVTTEETIPTNLDDQEEGNMASASAPSSSRARHENSAPPLDVDTSPRNRKVIEYIRRFMDKTAGITQESVAAEKERIAHGLGLAASRQSTLPDIVEKYDDEGYRWSTLDFGDGIVRYLPAEE